MGERGKNTAETQAANRQPRGVALPGEPQT